jgi:hypothetical protein
MRKRGVRTPQKHHGQVRCIALATMKSLLLVAGDGGMEPGPWASVKATDSAGAEVFCCSVPVPYTMQPSAMVVLKELAHVVNEQCGGKMCT